MDLRYAAGTSSSPRNPLIPGPFFRVSFFSGRDAVVSTFCNLWCLLCRELINKTTAKPAFATRITCCFFITLQASKAISTLDTMAAIKSLITRDEVVNQLVKREKNWAAREPGVMVVFCIVGVVAIALIGLFIHKKLAARKANKAVVV
ncbi:hypothetical protein CDV31_006551 [Fusarium ambrosium]|uniref:Uncharacterized protein n=1 Tax=Fusarium ambrosium TaxID=131363 RepID=A0A428UCI9_9HYPO|nr:hypothetical protein CDV31_006551 [Fusarium ambrosium]